MSTFVLVHGSWQGGWAWVAADMCHGVTMCSHDSSRPLRPGRGAVRAPWRAEPSQQIEPPELARS